MITVYTSLHFLLCQEITESGNLTAYFEIEISVKKTSVFRCLFLFFSEKNALLQPLAQIGYYFASNKKKNKVYENTITVYIKSNDCV